MGDSTTTETIERMLRPKTSRWLRLDGRMTETEVLERKERFLRMVGYFDKPAPARPVTVWRNPLVDSIARAICRLDSWLWTKRFGRK